jgi:hypothetical protein
MPRYRFSIFYFDLEFFKGIQIYSVSRPNLSTLIANGLVGLQTYGDSYADFVESLAIQ